MNADGRLFYGAFGENVFSGNICGESFGKGFRISDAALSPPAQFQQERKMANFLQSAIA
jgi:hypothetical protein